MGRAPEMNCPIKTLSDTLATISASSSHKLSSTAPIPAGTDDMMRMIPVTIVKMRMNPIGVGFDKLAHALSMSKALIRKAPPSMLITAANIISVKLKTVAMPAISSSIPGTPRKNFEYRESYAMVFRYLPSTAYEYSTLRLTFITTRCTDTTGSAFCITGMTLSSSSPSDTMTAPFAPNSPWIFLISASIFSSACTPLLFTPATVTTSTVYPLLMRSSYVFMAANIELESASSGSSNASRWAASMQESLPITGVLMPAFSPTSLSLSTHITSSLLAEEELTSFSTLPARCDMPLYSADCF